MKRLKGFLLTSVAFLYVFFSCHVFAQTALAASNYSVVGPTDERTDTSFNRRILVEVPDTILNAGMQDDLFVELPNNDVALSRIRYTITKDSFVNSTGLAVPINSKLFKIPVMGTGLAGKGYIVLDLEQIIAKKPLDDLQISLYGPPSSIFSTARLSLTRSAPLDYLFDIDSDVLTIEEFFAGSLPLGKNIIFFTLPEGYVWEKETLNVKATRGNISAQAEIIPHSMGRDLSLHVDQASTTKSILKLNAKATKKSDTLPLEKHTILVQVSGKASGNIDALEYTFPETKKPTAVLKIGSNEMLFHDKKVFLDTPPYISNSRVFVPVRYAAMAAGCLPEDITWYPSTSTVVLRLGNKTLKMTVGSTRLIIDDQIIEMDVAPVISAENRVMLPINWLFHSLDYSVTWIPEQQIINIQK